MEGEDRGPKRTTAAPLTRERPPTVRPPTVPMVTKPASMVSEKARSHQNVSVDINPDSGANDEALRSQQEMLESKRREAQAAAAAVSLPFVYVKSDHPTEACLSLWQQWDDWVPR